MVNYFLDTVVLWRQVEDGNEARRRRREEVWVGLLSGFVLCSPSDMTQFVPVPWPAWQGTGPMAKHINRQLTSKL